MQTQDGDDRAGWLRTFAVAIGTPTAHFFTRTGFKTSWHEPLLLTGAVAPLFVGYVPDEFEFPLIIAVAVLLSVGTIRGFYTKTATIDIETERDDLRQQLNAVEERELTRRGEFADAVDISLEQLAQNLGVWNPDSRLTLYTHNGSNFQMFRRKSYNPLHEKIGRGVYPEDEGVIAKAWQQGFPKVYAGLPVGEPAYGKKLLKEFNIPINTSKEFAMKSHSYLAVRVSDVARNATDHIGVLVIECVRPTGLNNDHKTRLIASTMFHALQVQLSTSREFLPDISDAQERGF